MRVWTDPPVGKSGRIPNRSWGSHKSSNEARRNANRIEIAPASCLQGDYQRRPMNCCWICLFGETDGGGLAIARVDGSTIGIALRVRWASGWWSLVCDEFCCGWYPAGVYGFGADDNTKLGVGCSWCWRGDDSGEPLDKDDRSDPEEWMDWSCP